MELADSQGAYVWGAELIGNLGGFTLQHGTAPIRMRHLHGLRSSHAPSHQHLPVFKGCQMASFQDQHRRRRLWHTYSRHQTLCSTIDTRMTIEICPMHLVDSVWPTLRQGFVDACRKGGNQFSEAGFHLTCRSGEAYLCLMTEGNDIIAAVIVQEQQWANRQVLHVLAATGGDHRLVGSDGGLGQESLSRLQDAGVRRPTRMGPDAGS